MATIPEALDIKEPRTSRSFRPPTGVAGAVFWLALWFGLLWLVRAVPEHPSPLLGWMQLLVGVALIGLAIPLAWRLLHQRLLWSLRNKLVITYLLIGLAPVVLFVTLVTISAYIAAGQFSIHLADTRMRQELEEIGMDNAALASRLGHIVKDRGKAALQQPPPGHAPPEQNQGAVAAQQSSTEVQAPAIALGEMPPDPLLARLHRHIAVYLNGAPLPSPPGAAAQTASGAPTVPLGLPAWAADLHGNQFRDLVLDGNNLYLVAIDQRHIEGQGILSIVTALPVDGPLMDVVAHGLGLVRLAGLMTGSSQPSVSATRTRAAQGRALGRELQRTSVYGGTEPVRANFCDFGVPFVSTVDIVDWDTGTPDSAPVEVHSRPSLLYRQLFGSSLGGIITDYIRYGLIGLSIAFAVIEAVALWAALRLSRQITSSVEELYAATQQVDHGNFSARIASVYATKQDQLGELARSFNRMTGSLERLLIEQQEKERLQSELTIAQEVQANLFPRHISNLPTLELHGICRPARSVSGDYYDFLVFQNSRKTDGSPGEECGVGLAIGDISGKGISAALLMATLHSAVRAYRLAGEDLVYSNGLPAATAEAIDADGGKLFESPGRILSLLNRHLYRTTQPEKYATLFLAHYDAITAQLTYSNAGHLPPLILRHDGKVTRLDCGGTVVGLLDGMHYQEDRIQMSSGDVLVAYSDGITEPENDFGEFGESRLLEVVARYRDQPLHVISAQVMLALDAWIGAAEQPDDITLVLARQV